MGIEERTISKHINNAPLNNLHTVKTRLVLLNLIKINHFFILNEVRKKQKIIQV